jgi:hypothetical protein
MTQGQIHALFAAGKISPEEAAQRVMAARDDRAAVRQRATGRNPIVLLCLLAVGLVASLFGVRHQGS